MVSDEDVDRLVQDLTREAEARGYRLNPDREFARALVRGLLSNRERYGYISCPCRLAS
ncbi:MAG: ferredoxin:glutaredoxin reductase, partial [Methanoculleus sp.]|nr:ferredoxin:glutaredoxin reductase [Methanoculleus sp.]